MAWRVKRIDTTGDHGGEECSDLRTQPTSVTLENTATGAVETINICWFTTPGSECDNLNLLATAGFTPNDWTGVCPPV